jgi:2-oxoglutarate ferredoxin oxidoreductase subunit delta
MARPVFNYDDYSIRINRHWCKGCGICTALCPNKVLLLDNRGKAVAAYPASCTGCGKCETHCPDFAISVERHAEKERIAVYAGNFSHTGRAPGRVDGARV